GCRGVHRTRCRRGGAHGRRPLVLLSQAPHRGVARRLRRAPSPGPVRDARGGRARAPVGGRAQRAARRGRPQVGTRL
ncbi:MAG: hypothetical protein AVDCRST_MAG57-3882, partial [uncultured Blastococcus sp.]